jgi:Family of unknown function (DUF6152)
MINETRIHRQMRLCTLLLAAGLAICSMHASAHHSFAAEFDINRPVEFRGRVIKVELINPHSWIHLEVTDQNGGKETWMIEGGSPNQLFRKGFTKTSVPIGTELQVSGYQARDGAKRAVGRTLKLANGDSLFFETTPIPEATH